MRSKLRVGGSIETGGGSVVAGDLINIVLQLVQKSVPPGDPLPQRFKSTMSNFNVLIASIRAWKGAHNSLDEIRNRYDPFRRLLELARVRQSPLPFYEVRNPWRFVGNKLDGLTSKIEEIQLVEALYTEKQSEMELPSHTGDTDEVLRKSRQLLGVALHISQHLSIDPEQVLALRELTAIQRLSSQVLWRIGLPVHWWQTLFEWSDDFDSKLTEAMYLTDQVLRQSADALFEYSQRHLGGHWDA